MSNINEQNNTQVTGAIQPSTNKSDRELGNKFDGAKFNKEFEEADIKLLPEDIKLQEEYERNKNKIRYNKQPHEKPFEDILIISRETFYGVLSCIMNGENPYNYIISTPDRFFSFGLLILMIGCLLMLLNNIFI